MTASPSGIDKINGSYLGSASTAFKIGDTLYGFHNTQMQVQSVPDDNTVICKHIGVTLTKDEIKLDFGNPGIFRVNKPWPEKVQDF